MDRAGGNAPKKIHNDLIEAYIGLYEDEFIGDAALSTRESQVAWASDKIRRDPPKERLAVYLQWNGIIGYTGRIYDIATGEFES